MLVVFPEMQSPSANSGSPLAASAIAAVTPPPPSQDQRRVARGLVALVISQLLQMPLSTLANAVLARKLGAADFGTIFFASTFVGVAFLFVEWGQSTTIPGEVAKDRSRAESLLGTSLLLKVSLGVVATCTLVALGRLLGYAAEARVAIAFLAVQAILVSLQTSGSSVLRGFERTEVVSVLGLLGSLLGATLSMSAALAGTGLTGVLAAMTAGSALMIAPTAFLLRRDGLARPHVSKAAAHQLLDKGTGFLALAAVLALQPYVDAYVLSLFAPAEAMGWHAAARRMTGLLIFPATSLAFALYPTVARLHHEAPEQLASLMSKSLRLMILTSIPAAVGTVVFAAPVVHLIYGATGFDGAILNLQVLAPWVLLVYFSILLGNPLVAMGKVKSWTLAQSACVVVSVVLDPPLIRYFHGRLGNGPVGVAVSSVISELLVLVCAIRLTPASLFGGAPLRTLGFAAVAGAAMAAVGVALSRWVPLAMGASVAAYVLVLWSVGAVKKEDATDLIAMVGSKLAAKLGRK